MQGFKDFDPAKDIPDLSGKVVLVTGGTEGLGEGCIRAFTAHNPLHIYFTGRNASTADALISEIKLSHPTTSLTFIKMDLSSLRTVKEGIAEGFRHDRLDILMNNAGIIAKPAILSTDGYEIQFTTNHLGHAMPTKELLPILLRTAQHPGSDVRVITNTSEGYMFHRFVEGGISFSELDAGSTMSRAVLGSWIRYGQSKFANILFASELARRYPALTSVVIHPGLNKTFVSVTSRMSGTKWLQAHEGILNQLWCAAGAKKGELRNGGFYMPVGVNCTDQLTIEAKDGVLAERLWEWAGKVLSKY
ncbi:NAD(P)-binding protein [Decorospora gaudefroyi]|uniref:NAD(P)-binding protein n=1 Tax=Decorospora gaudefroyi TaxID=184978 RepID=A0A6A5KHM3_9PLEO|nr:NAD(P)-binding protein [Decorospora gaudefroyi]